MTPRGTAATGLVHDIMVAGAGSDRARVLAALAK